MKNINLYSLDSINKDQKIILYLGILKITTFINVLVQYLFYIL